MCAGVPVNVETKPTPQLARSVLECHREAGAGWFCFEGFPTDIRVKLRKSFYEARLPLTNERENISQGGIGPADGKMLERARGKG